MKGGGWPYDGARCRMLGHDIDEVDLAEMQRRYTAMLNDF
jgi:hypothetical protein